MTWSDELLRKLPAPEPPGELLTRILASRAKGVRVTLPVPRPVTASRRVLRFAALAAAVAGVSWLGWKTLVPSASVESDLPPAWVIGGTPFLPSPAFGQERTPRTWSPRYPLIRHIQAARLGAGRWTYESRTIADGVFTTSQGRSRTLVITRGRSDGQAVWVVSSSLMMEDTVLVDPSTLRPRRYVRPMVHARIVQQFSPDSLAEALFLARPREPERTVQATAALPNQGAGPMLVSWSAHSLEVLVQVLPLSRSWRGSVYTVNWLAMRPHLPAFSPLDIRVTGAERITVPAGTFDCWRLEVMEGNDRSVLWVSKDHGWLVLKRHTSVDDPGKWQTEWLNETQLVAMDTVSTAPPP
jgi:hypothetical protein